MLAPTLFCDNDNPPPSQSPTKLSRPKLQPAVANAALLTRRDVNAYYSLWVNLNASPSVPIGTGDHRRYAGGRLRTQREGSAARRRADARQSPITGVSLSTGSRFR